MKCENCKKRDATVHLTEIKNGAKQEMHLCEPCAAEKGLPGKAHFSISDLLAGIASHQQAQKGKRTKDVQCPACELTLSQFQATGRFGCGECYTAFRDEILPLIEKIHDSTQHMGKVPQRASPEVSMQKELRHLQLELKRAIKREDYEKAARLRDEVRRLEEQLRAHGVALPGESAPPAGRSTT
jgi:protein arginine kinase activator